MTLPIDDKQDIAMFSRQISEVSNWMSSMSSAQQITLLDSLLSIATNEVLKYTKFKVDRLMFGSGSPLLGSPSPSNKLGNSLSNNFINNNSGSNNNIGNSNSTGLNVNNGSILNNNNNSRLYSPTDTRNDFPYLESSPDWQQTDASSSTSKRMLSPEYIPLVENNNNDSLHQSKSCEFSNLDWKINEFSPRLPHLFFQETENYTQSTPTNANNNTTINSFYTTRNENNNFITMSNEEAGSPLTTNKDLGDNFFNQASFLQDQFNNVLPNKNEPYSKRPPTIIDDLLITKSNNTNGNSHKNNKSNIHGYNKTFNNNNKNGVNNHNNNGTNKYNHFSSTLKNNVSSSSNDEKIISGAIMSPQRNNNNTNSFNKQQSPTLLTPKKKNQNHSNNNNMENGTGDSTSSINMHSLYNSKVLIDPILLNDIPKWLKLLRLHKYSDALCGIYWEDLIMLTDDKLSELGVTTLGARRKLLKVFVILNDYKEQNLIDVSAYRQKSN